MLQSHLTLPLLCLAVVHSFVPEKSSAADRYRAAQPHMGTKFTITLEAETEDEARQAFTAAFERIEQLDSALSDYVPDSELNRLCRQAPTPDPVEVSTDLYRVLAAAQQISEQSGGAFDCTVGPLTKLWRAARRQRELPPTEALATAQAAVGYRHVELSQRDGKHFVRLTQPNMQLDLGGIAKGYALDEALATLQVLGIEAALVDGGGDVAFSAAPHGTEGWRIGVAPLEPSGPPSGYLRLAHRGIATSGDAWQFVEIAGKRYSHIVDPATGLGLQQRSSVTVLAPTGMQADALASAVSVLGPEEGLALINKLEQVEALIVVASGEQTKTYRSAGIDAMLELPSASQP